MKIKMCGKKQHLKKQLYAASSKPNCNIEIGQIWPVSRNAPISVLNIHKTCPRFQKYTVRT